MRIIITIAFLFILNLTFASKEKVTVFQIDSIINSKIEQNQDSLLTEVQKVFNIQLAINKKEYLEIIDSLNYNINSYEQNEKYYSNALSSQTTIFSVIVTILLVLTGLISYTSFKLELKKVKKQYKQSIENYKKIEERFSETDYELYSAIGLLWHEKGLRAESIKFFARAFSHACEYVINSDEIIENINTVNKVLNSLSDSEIKILKKDKEEIFKYLDKTSNINNSEILNCLSIMRVELIKKTNT